MVWIGVGSMNVVNLMFLVLFSILVLFMMFGLVFFYGGLVFKWNVVNIMLFVFMICGLVILLWFVFGYLLFFFGDLGGFVGNFKVIWLYGVDLIVFIVIKIFNGLYFIF